MEYEVESLCEFNSRSYGNFEDISDVVKLIALDDEVPAYVKSDTAARIDGFA